MKTEIRRGKWVKKERLERDWTQEYLPEVAEVSA